MITCLHFPLNSPLTLFVSIKIPSSPLMASASKRFFTRSTFSSLKSSLSPKLATTPPPLRKPSNPTVPSSSSGLCPFPVSRFHTELRCLTSLLPLHSAVASARMTSRLSSTSRNITALLQVTCCLQTNLNKHVLPESIPRIVSMYHLGQAHDFHNA